MLKIKPTFEPTVADVMIDRMKDKSFVLYHRSTDKSDKYELIDQHGQHVEWVHPDVASLAHSRLSCVGGYVTNAGDTVRVYKPKKGK